MPLEFIIGPPVKEMTRVAAENALLGHPDFPKGAEYKVQAHDGRWYAAYHIADSPFGGPADSEEESPAPKSEGPDDTAPSDDGPPKSDPDSGEDGPPSDGPPEGLKDEKGEKGGGKAGKELHQLLDLLTQVAEALGVPIGGEDDSMVPGLDAGPPPDLGGPPPGLGGPPPGAGGPPGGPDKTIHEKSLKPGEVPPGGTPLGAPAFASVSKDHPWAHTIGVVPHFRVTEAIGDRPIAEINAELQTIAGNAFKVSKLQPLRDENGERVVTAVISTPQI